METGTIRTLQARNGRYFTKWNFLIYTFELVVLTWLQWAGYVQTWTWERKEMHTKFCWKNFLEIIRWQ